MSSASIREIFDQAHALAAPLRGAFLDQHCDPETRAQVEKLLLAADSLNCALLERDPAEWSHTIGESDRFGAAAVGTIVGPFVIVEPLGEGGSARVFRATRTVEGVVQTVALKVLRHSLANEHARLQFDRERQALVRLVHPNIAQFIDGGVSAQGDAWIALEFVDGAPLVQHALAAKLPPHQRLQLMINVANAVSAAHRNLIVHRDLKPSNVLVTATGEVKLLDFGIAKLLSAEPSDQTHTQTQFRAFTPAYAAPEQRNGGAITTATDVYALGVLLGELLTGELAPSKDGTTPAPARTATTRASASASVPARGLRGDLHNILRKATASAPEERYDTAAAFAADIQRFLNGEPVLAHPPSGWYQMRKFIARHRGGVSIVSLLLLGIVASLLLALWQSREAQISAQLAQRQEQRVAAVNQFLLGLFDSQIPRGPNDALPTTAALLERGVAQALALKDNPSLQASQLVALARVYDHLARGDAALPLLEQALLATQGLHPPEPQLRAQVLSERGALDLQRDRFREALNWLRQAEALQQAPGGDPLKLALTLDRIAQAQSYLGEHESALASYHQALAMRQTVLAADDPEIINSEHAIGTALDRAGRPIDAAPWLQRAVTKALARLGPDHVKTAHYSKNYAANLRLRDQIAQALPLLEQAVVSERRLYPPGHPARALGLTNLANSYWLSGRFDDANGALVEAFELLTNAGESDSFGAGVLLGMRARLHESLGDLKAARRDSATALRLLRTLVGDHHERVLMADLVNARLNALDDPSAAHLAALQAKAERILNNPEALHQFRSRALIEARHSHAWLLAQRGAVEEAAAAREQALQLAPPSAIEPILFADVAATARWRLKQQDLGGADDLVSTWIDRADRQLNATPPVVGELFLIAAEIARARGEETQRRQLLSRAENAFQALPAQHPLHAELLAAARD